MTHGKVVVVRAALLAAVFCLAALWPPLPVCAQKALPPLHTHGKLQPVTVLSGDDQTLHLTLMNGTAQDVLIRPSSLFLKDGLMVSAVGVPRRGEGAAAGADARLGRRASRWCCSATPPPPTHWTLPQEDAGGHGAEPG